MVTSLFFVDFLCNLWYNSLIEEIISSERARKMIKTVGEFLKNRRQKYNLTQVELSKRLGIDINRLKRMENDKISVDSDTENSLAEIFELDDFEKEDLHILCMTQNDTFNVKLDYLLPYQKRLLVNFFEKLHCVTKKDYLRIKAILNFPEF